MSLSHPRDLPFAVNLPTTLANKICALLDPTEDCFLSNDELLALSNVDQPIRDLPGISSQEDSEFGAEISEREPRASALLTSKVRAISEFATLGNKSGDNLRAGIPDEQINPIDSLALKSSSDMLYHGTHNHDSVSAPAAVVPDCSGNSDTNSKFASGGMKKGKRAYSPETKTGCVTCRQKRKKCDENKPFCM